MQLVIVESPVKARTLNLFLGKDYRVVSTMGHIRDLPEKKFGIKIKITQNSKLKTQNYEFLPEYVLVPKKKEAVERLKQEASQAQKIFLATDPDREGEAIAWHVLAILKLDNRNLKLDKEARKSKIENQTSNFQSQDQVSNFQRLVSIQRIVFHEITKSAIEKALANPEEINLQLVDAQQARRVLDRIVGYKLSPLLWRKIRRGLSAGRVQSVALRLVVEREREIEKFTPVEYWEIWAELRRHIGGLKEGMPTFLAKLVKENGQVIKVENENVANQIVQELKGANYEVAEVEKKEIFQNPAPPFITSTLQQRAAQVLGFSSSRTMRVAQSLYEKGLITYHRTDSVNLAHEAIAAIRQYIATTYPKDYLPATPRIYKTKSKVAQEAHEAVRPTDVKVRVGSEKWEVGRDEQRLYDLIWKRAVACQMSAAVFDQTKVKVQAAGEKNIYGLVAEGKVMKFAGWLIAYGGTENLKLKTESLGERLPELKQGDDLDLLKIDPQQKFTQPPPRYTEGSLIKALEERGIGRPSTYAPIVSTIQGRNYVEKVEGKFKTTALGEVVCDFLLEYFPDIFDYQFTAKMEDELDDIANGKIQWMPVINDFYKPFEEKLTAVRKVAERVAVPTEATDEKCPKCQEGQLVIRVGRFGKFLSCSRFPECDYTAPFIQTVEGVKCPKCGGEVVIKKTKKGKQFYGCGNYPKCNWASWRKPR